MSAGKSATPKMNGLKGRLKGLLSKAVAAEAHSEAEGSTHAETKTIDLAAVVKQALKTFSVPGSGLSAKSPHVTVAAAADEIFALYADPKSNVLRPAVLETMIAALEKSARDEESSSSGTSVSARIGEMLHLMTSTGEKKKFNDIIKEWDPNSDGSVTKQEFRLNVRALFKKAKGAPETKDVDALFMSLDDDGGGTLDTKELKQALKKMMDAHSNMLKLGDNTKAAAAKFREQAKEVRDGHLATLLAFEAACAALKAARSETSVGSELGDIIAGKGMKAADVARKWDSSGDGDIDKKEFQKNVLAMGVTHSADEVDALFDSLDADGGGSLDMNEVRKALKHFMDDAEKRRIGIRKAGLEVIAKFKAARRAQAEYQAEQTAQAP